MMNLKIHQVNLMVARLELFANVNPPIITINQQHNAFYPRSVKAAVLCTAAIAKSNCEDNSVQGIIAIGAVVDIRKVVKC